MNQPTTAPLLVRRNGPRLQGLIAGLAVCTLLILADQLSMHYGLKESQRVLDDISGGIIVGLLVFWYQRTKSRYLTERLRIIALMNHHVRNALQVIAYSAYLPPDAEQVLRMKDAVKRIEWALQEVLPGQLIELYQDQRRFPEETRGGGVSAAV